MNTVDKCYTDFDLIPCCDLCCETIALYLDPCPICKSRTLTDTLDIEPNTKFICKMCKTKFNLLSYEFYRSDQDGFDAELEILEKHE